VVGEKIPCLYVSDHINHFPSTLRSNTNTPSSFCLKLAHVRIYKRRPPEHWFVDRYKRHHPVDSNWLDHLSRSAHPIIVAGYNDPLHPIRGGLTKCFVAGPAISDYSGSKPGFNLIMRSSAEVEAPTLMLQGFKQIPPVDDILQISNTLLEGKIPPTPTVPPRQIPSFTLP
jgi:hypothetical protein